MFSGVKSIVLSHPPALVPMSSDGSVLHMQLDVSSCSNRGRSAGSDWHDPKGAMPPAYVFVRVSSFIRRYCVLVVSVRCMFVFLQQFMGAFMKFSNDPRVQQSMMAAQEFTQRA
jgi:hypothetical protein